MARRVFSNGEQTLPRLRLSSTAAAPPAPPPPIPELKQLVVGPDPAAHPRLLRREMEPRDRHHGLVLGAVSYCEAVGSIWRGMMRHFARCGLEVDFVMFSSYERQVSALLSGHIDIAWNGPLAHARLLRLLQKERGTKSNNNNKDGEGVGEERPLMYSLGMRDVDRDFKSHIVARKDVGVSSLSDINGRLVGAGTVDSPQAYIMPLHFLKSSGKVDLSTLTVTRFDRDIGKHGDTAYGEDGVLEALESGGCDVGFISDLMWKRYEAAGRTRNLVVIESTSFDHCQFDALPTLNAKRAALFQSAVLSMDGNGHPEDKKTMELEGIKKLWLPARGGSFVDLGAGDKSGSSTSTSNDSSSNNADGDKKKPKPKQKKAAFLSSAVASPFPNPSAGYEGMLAALDSFDEKKVRWPGVLHTPDSHPFRHLMIDSKLILDMHGC